MYTTILKTTMVDPLRIFLSAYKPLTHVTWSAAPDQETAYIYHPSDITETIHTWIAGFKAGRASD